MSFPPEIFPILAIGSAFVAAGLVDNDKKTRKNEQLIFTGRCRAPLRTVLTSLDNLINVRPPGAQYPLSRYWLELQNADYQRGSVSAVLEFVEEVVRTKILGFETGQAKAIIKKFGFIWYAEEILMANQVELAVSLVWKELTPGKPSKYEELIIHTVVGLTRDIVSKLDQAALKAIAPASSAPISGPPPVNLNSGANSWTAPPPSAGMITPPNSSGNSSQQKTPLRAALGGFRQKNKMAFADMMGRASRVTAEDPSAHVIDWPSPLDFHEAVQNPSTCFADKYLRNGQTYVDSMGMPRVSSGAFASVYRIRCQDRDRAVRCFLNPVKDQKFRYEILANALDVDELPWTVEFDYADQGICIAGKWYPILTMDWVDGTPLNIHLASLCQAKNVEAIEDLRLHFQDMMHGLHEAQVAHGDLQHGNILVRDDELVLVDYDGMFVPELGTQKSNELGHANYQHPARSERDFNENIDRFSAWVIDTAMLCLREDPSLWTSSYDDGESMLFHRRDFVSPANSAILAHLLGHPSSVVRQRADFFGSLLELRIDDIPPLQTDEQVTPIKYESKKRGEPEKMSGSNSPQLPDWLTDVE
jgi:hypothetical protein